MTLPPLTDAQRELWDERSAILEFDAGLSRPEAEREALRMVLGREKSEEYQEMRLQWD